MVNQPAHQFWVVIVGPGCVGKSALTLQFMYEEHPEEYEPTRMDSYRKDFILDGESIAMHILDTAGQEGFDVVCDNFYRQSQGAILVYDATDEATFHAMLPFWENLIRCKNVDIPVSVVLANKIDRDDVDPAAIKLGEEFARERNLPFFQTSAKTDANVVAAFHKIAREVLQHESAIGQSSEKASKKKRKFCCMW